MRAGIQTMTSLLARRPDGNYGLHIAPRCVHTIAEYGSYQYATRAGGAAIPRSSRSSRTITRSTPPVTPYLPRWTRPRHHGVPGSNAQARRREESQP